MKLVFSLSPEKLKTAAMALFMLATVSLHARKVELHSAPPPVFWNVFTGEVVKGKVVLKWLVTEYNNEMFYIEHSLNGRDWTTIDSLRSKFSLLTEENYGYTHSNKLEGRQYYRVKQVDLEAANTGYSKVVTLVLHRDNTDPQDDSPITLSPNPATDRVRIVDATSKDNRYVKAAIFDLGGKQVAEKSIDKHSNVVSIKELPAGIYLMRAYLDNGIFYTQKIIKQ